MSRGRIELLSSSLRESTLVKERKLMGIRNVCMRLSNFSKSETHSKKSFQKNSIYFFERIPSNWDKKATTYLKFIKIDVHYVWWFPCNINSSQNI